MEAGGDKRAPPPEWINSKFIESALKNDKSEQVNVISVDVKYANPVGAGYGSTMFRVTASVKDEADNEMKKSLILKVDLPATGLQEAVEESLMFTKEILMLGQVIPEVHAILESTEGSSLFQPLTAHCYHTGHQPVDFLVLEDLTVADFRLAKPEEPLDWQHCSMVMRAYARLHAASALVLKRQPQYREMLTSNMFTGQGTQNFFRTIGSKLLGGLADELEELPEYKKYSSKYRSYFQQCDDLEYEAIIRNRNETKLTIITHGDCWKNNFMFKYVEGAVSEVRLIDFQLSTVASPAADLQYFLFGNPSEDVHRHHMDSLLLEYHDTLTEMLRRVGLEEEAETYTFQELQNDMDRCSLYALLFSGMSSMSISSDKLGPEVSKFFADPNNAGDTCRNVLKNPYSLPYMKYASTVFEKKGFF